MLTPTLKDIADRTQLVTDRSTVAPGELVFAHLALPVRGDSAVLGAYAYTLDVVWSVTTSTAPSVPGKDFIAPSGLDKTHVAFGLMPPLSSGLPANTAVPTTDYTLVAELTFQRVQDPSPLGTSPITHTVAKVTVVTATGLLADEIEKRVTELFKVVTSGTLLEPGAPVSARLRLRSSDDSPWDVEAAEHIAPEFELAGKVQLAPINRIISTVAGVSNQLRATGVGLLAPIVKVLGVVAKAVWDIAEFITEGPLRHLPDSIIGQEFPKDPLAGMDVSGDVNRALKELRGADLANLKDGELPIDVRLANQNFTKHLVPHDAVPPIPGPSRLMPTVPTLEQHVQTYDTLPAAAAGLPILGALHAPLDVTSVSWELWRSPASVAVRDRLIQGAPLGTNNLVWPSPTISVPTGYAAAVGPPVTDIVLTPADIERLPSDVPFWMLWWERSTHPDPFDDPNLEIVQITAVYESTSTIRALRGAYGTLNADHNTGGEAYSLRVAGDFFVSGPDNLRFNRTFVIEPPLTPMGTVYLRVRVTYATHDDVNNASLPGTAALYPAGLPIHLVGFDPLAFVAEQIELTLPVGEVEAGSVVSAELATALPLTVLSPDEARASLPLRLLPIREFPVSIRWAVFDEAQQPLAEGVDYAIGGPAALSRSLVFVPPVEIMRRQNPVPALRDVSVTLTSAVGSRHRTLRPARIAVRGFYLPMFIALLRRRFFKEHSQEWVHVLIPNYYLTQAPEWVQNWDAFRGRIMSVRDRIASVLSLFGGGPAAPRPAGGLLLSSDTIGALTIVHGALDYVANRALLGPEAALGAGGVPSESLTFTKDQPWGMGIWEDDDFNGYPFDDMRTAIVVNDLPTAFLLVEGNWVFWDIVVVTPGARNPITILDRSANSGPWRFNWFPDAGWPASVAVSVTSVRSWPERDWRLNHITAVFDQHLPLNNWFPMHAAEVQFP